jgi:hypothetical protein
MDVSIFVHDGTGSRIPLLTASLAARIVRNNDWSAMLLPLMIR